MKLSEMKQLLSEGDIQLTKSLGQNFLHDRNQLLRIVAAADLKAIDQVLEIGPGLGPLTALLLAQAQKVLAIEKDARLLPVLEQRFGKNLLLVHDDALAYLRREPRDWTGWKMISNLPYSVASPIMVELAQGPNGPQHIVATLQLEVCRRLVAGPGDDDYGLLSLLVQLNYRPEQFFKIPATCFFPEPEVDSGCVSLRRRNVPLLTPELQVVFKKIVKRSFSQRRKMMLKLLKQDWPADVLARAFADTKLSVQTRAEALSLTQFVELTRSLVTPSSGTTPAP
jgi:16S rRNA (adenine1518-N6/adenine1519-N6)-dimethyltransferase